MGFPRWCSWYRICSPMKEMQKTMVRSLGQDDPWSRKWQPKPVFLLGKCHGQRSLVGNSPWGHKESDMTVWLSTAQHMGHFRNFSLNSSPWNFAMMYIFRNLFSCIKFTKGPFYSGDPNYLFPGTFCIIIFLSCVMTSFYFICSFWKSCHLNVILFQFFFFFSYILFLVLEHFLDFIF